MDKKGDQRIDGRYLVVKSLGKGLMGEVSLVRDEKTGEAKALKLLRQNIFSLSPEEALKRFKQEFAFLQELRHPHIARIYDFGFDHALGCHYFTEEFIDGIDLLKATALMDPSEIEELIVQALRALEFLHARQVFHFDLKPANLLVEQVSVRLKVIDFGLANLPGQMVAGTPAYMAPEICLQASRDGRADLYALGVIWYKCLTRQNPFVGKTTAETLDRHVKVVPPPVSHERRDVPPYLDPILARLLAKNPSDRYDRAAMVIRDLNFLGGRNYLIETDETQSAYLPDVGALIGREAAWKQITEALRRGPERKIILISGDHGLGKSRLCSEVKYLTQLAGGSVQLHDFDHELTPHDRSALRAELRGGTLCVVAVLPKDAEELASWLPPESLLYLPLSPFSEKDIERYLRHVTGAERIPEVLCRAVLRRTEGNPRHVRELMVACFAKHTFFDAMGRWSEEAFEDLRAEVEQLPLPPSMGEWFQTRGERLPPEAREALKILSVAVAPLSSYVVERFAGPLAAWLNPLAREGWVVRHSGRIELKNPAVRDWLMGEMLDPERQALHDFLVCHAHDCPEEEADFHFVLGGGLAEDLPRFDRYVEKLKKEEKWDQVARTLGHAWRVLPLSQDRISRGIGWVDALIECGDHPFIQKGFEEVRSAVAELPQRSSFELTLAEAEVEWLLHRREYTTAHERLKSLLQKDRGIAERIRLENYLGRVAFELGDLGQAKAMLRKTWEETERLPLALQGKTLNNDLGLVLLAQGKVREARDHFARELERILPQKDWGLEARCYYNLGEACRGLHEEAAASQWFQKAYQLSQRLGRHELTLRILNALGNLHHEQNQTEEAITCYERGLRMAERLGDRSCSAALATNLGILYHTAGRNADAFSHLAYVRHLLHQNSRTSVENQYLARGLLEYADLMQEGGDLAAAKKTLQEIKALGENSILPFLEEKEKELAMEGHKESMPPAWQQLFKINQQLARETDGKHLLDQVLVHAVELSRAELGLILLLDEGGELKVEAALNVEPDEALSRVSTTFAKKAIASGLILASDDALSDAALGQYESVIVGQLRSILCLPIYATGKVIGCLYLSHRFRGGAFREVDRSLLAAFADQAGIAIERVRLLQATEAKANRLMSTLREREEELTRLEARVRSAKGEELYRLKELQSMNPSMGRLFELVTKVMATDLSVFLHGETGTGKEVLARLFHTHHPERSKGSFIAVSCGALPKELMESELFGYRTGAFTGAVRDKVGLFEAAEGGTLFLDEVAELPLELQAKLLRVLQEKEVRRLGDTTARKVDCRIVSASHRDLRSLLKTGSFREDLYYRLCQIQIDIPPLRERREDIPMLVGEFIKRHGAKKSGKEIRMGQEVMRVFLAYDWPGNVRELEHLVQAMCALCDGRVLRLADIPPHHPLAQTRVDSPSPDRRRENGKMLSQATEENRRISQNQAVTKEDVLIDATNPYEAAKGWRDYENVIVAKAFQHYQNDIPKTAGALGVSKAKLYKRVNDLGLRNPQNSLYQDPFCYQEISLDDYKAKIFRAALQLAKRPYGAIRLLRVSPGYFYKVVPPTG